MRKRAENLFSQKILKNLKISRVFLLLFFLQIWRWELFIWLVISIWSLCVPVALLKRKTRWRHYRSASECNTPVRRVCVSVYKTSAGKMVNSARPLFTSTGSGIEGGKRRRRGTANSKWKRNLDLHIYTFYLPAGIVWFFDSTPHTFASSSGIGEAPSSSGPKKKWFNISSSIPFFSFFLTFLEFVVYILTFGGLAFQISKSGCEFSPEFCIFWLPWGTTHTQKIKNDGHKIK